ncbi:MAG: hypothetical protein KIT56_10100 [Gammaproteobacteria bacterium]|nr:hypothetical protein [Gammaproteobacteria bacterium]MCW5584201.1 hypothetical protein [Gammaproteobacteria bacterium]
MIRLSIIFIILLISSQTALSKSDLPKLTVLDIRDICTSALGIIEKG